MRRGAGVAERDCLENSCTRKGTVSSNLTPAASTCIIGTPKATQAIKDGDTVEVRANHGTVRILG